MELVVERHGVVTKRAPSLFLTLFGSLYNNAIGPKEAEALAAVLKDTQIKELKYAASPAKDGRPTTVSSR